MGTTTNRKRKGVSSQLRLGSSKYVNLIAIGGHVAAGKDILTRRLIEKMSIKGVPVEFKMTNKQRHPRPSEIDGIDYIAVDPSEWRKKERRGELPIQYARGGVRYGFPKSLLDALKENRAHQIVNLDILGLPMLRTYFQQHSIPNKIIAIGLYCGEYEARGRIIAREQLTAEQTAEIVNQINTLHEQFVRYRRHPEQFRYLFYNPNLLATLDHLVDRTMDLLARETQYSKLSDSNFHHQYARDQTKALFGMDPDDLEGKLTHGERVRLQFNEEDFAKHQDKYGTEDNFGPFSIGTLAAASQRDVSTVINAYGIFNVLLDHTDSLQFSSRDILRNRRILQQLIKLRLGVPQYENTTETVRLEYVSRRGLIRSYNSMLSFVISFSPFDIFPLVGAEPYLLDVSAPLHTLSIECVVRHSGKDFIVKPLPKEDVYRYVKNNF